jgi:hypothetical protein
MKKLIGLIFIVGLMIFSPTDSKAADGVVTVDRLEGGIWIHYRVTGLDSLDAFTSPPFDASAAISWFLTTQNAYKERDTTIANYFRLGNLFANVVTGTSNDSLGLLKLQGAMSDGIYRNFDTLSTAKATPIRSRIDLYNIVCLYTSWKLSGSIFDTGTVSATVYVDIFIPYFGKGKGGSERGQAPGRAKGKGTQLHE